MANKSIKKEEKSSIAQRNEVAGKKDNLQKTIQTIIQEVSEDICDNYCKYRDTADEDNLCDAIRDGNPCPLDRLL